MSPQTRPPPPNDVAVVCCLGYNAPTTPDPLGYGAATEGAKAFTPFVDDRQATHQLSNDHYHGTVIGHSYGSAVIAQDLNIDPRHVGAIGTADDPIAGNLGSVPGVHGEEPTDPAFANTYIVDTQGHSAYWSENSHNLRNQTYVITGQHNQVSIEFGSPPQP
jgi:hypothetical protein